MVKGRFTRSMDKKLELVGAIGSACAQEMQSGFDSRRWRNVFAHFLKIAFAHFLNFFIGNRLPGGFR